MEVPLPPRADVVAYLLPPALTKLAARLARLGHNGRLFAIRWSVEADDGYLRWHACHELGDGWIVNEYKPGTHAAKVALPSPAAVSHCMGGAEVADEEDGSVEWQSLPCDIFEDPNLVPIDCEAFEMNLGVGVPLVSVRPQRAIFERRYQALGPGSAQTGEGADAARMTGALLWDSSVVLASMLAHRCAGKLEAATLEDPPRRCRCIELGAGLGLVGLAAAALGFDVVLTDRTECVPLLEDGIRANQLGSRATARALEWGDVRAAEELGTFDLVLASDCIYETAVAPRLVETMVALLGSPQHGRPKGEVWIAYDEAIGRPHAVDAFRACATASALRWEAFEADDDGEDCIDERARNSGAAVPKKNSVRMAKLIHDRIDG